MIKKEEIYVTSDGYRYKDEKIAQKHEDKITKQKENRERVITLDNGKTLTHDEIVEFFNKTNCKVCPFCKECDEMYQRCRMATTNTFNLCEVIKGKVMDDAFDDW